MSKVPAATAREKYIGIEIEAYAPYTWDEINFKLKQHAAAEYCELDTDGSIDVDQEKFKKIYGKFGDSFELKVMCKYSNLRTVLRIVQGFLTSIKAETNGSCGLHVHLDMRNFDVLKAFKNLYGYQSIFLNTISDSRLRKEYCNPITSYCYEEICNALSSRTTDVNKIIENIKDILNKANVSDDKIDDILEDTFAHLGDTDYDDGYIDHYQGISVEPFVDGRYKTIEIRFHEGTVDSNEIYNWCSTLYNIAYNNKPTDVNNKYIKERVSRAKRINEKDKRANRY